MQDYIYSSVAFLAIIIHLIINFNVFPGRSGFVTAYGNRYRGFLAGIFAYYVVDVGWGVFAGLGWTRVLYANTALYYIAIAMTVVMWCRYVVAYLNLGNEMFFKTSLCSFSSRSIFLPHRHRHASAERTLPAR